MIKLKVINGLDCRSWSGSSVLGRRRILPSRATVIYKNDSGSTQMAKLEFKFPSNPPLALYPVPLDCATSRLLLLLASTLRMCQFWQRSPGWRASKHWNSIERSCLPDGEQIQATEIITSIPA
ncbi:hypothetical protein I7I50_05055 [Histoplasma capsulatum G186AR]|uniref:Uncharacterized protein n=1 Tax=Ajellomyces capsulatus TaxID=5037 RepID=A0A8H7Z8S9_AJECA|nr:hypothetical protein I7I52_03313 [Histoplasma capsulatum]QSS75795.1 hypothetical protein I7I50_05055 [Histoplasma capsulatum G186AR]